jgi:hypothetical protein
VSTDQNFHFSDQQQINFQLQIFSSKILFFAHIYVTEIEADLWSPSTQFVPLHVFWSRLRQDDAAERALRTHHTGLRQYSTQPRVSQQKVEAADLLCVAAGHLFH